MTGSSATKRARKTRSRPPSAGWWGNGPDPADCWAGVTIRIAAKWVASRGRWETKDGKYWYDGDVADRTAEFFPERLEHHKGEFAGLPFNLLPYQEFLIVRPLFGWKRGADGRQVGHPDGAGRVAACAPGASKTLQLVSITQ